MNINLFTCCVLLLLGPTSFCQELATNYPLKNVFDSTAYPFYYIHPEKTSFQVKLPDIQQMYSSLSRSLPINGVNSSIPILIGRSSQNVDFIVIDANADYDLTNDSIVYFPDTLTSPTKGNYKTLKATIKVGGNREVPLEFDYSIIKPVQLRIDHGDSLENRIHLMVRPHQYRRATVSDGQEDHSLIVFSKANYDFTRKSSFLVVVPDSLETQIINANTTGINKYLPGDIVLAGKAKFLFKGISALGDTLFLDPLTASYQGTGNKVGFEATGFSGKDILSDQQLLLNNWRGKYVLLDFWGTWCAPCLKLLPDLKRMHATFDRSKIVMAGICYDRDIDVVKRFLKKHEIDWFQIFDSRQNPAITKSYEINAYPSFILIDPEGRIVFRDEGLNGMQRLLDQMSKYVPTN